MRIKHSNHNVYSNPALQPILTLTMRRPIAYCAGRMINPPDRFIKILRKGQAIPAWKSPVLRDSSKLVW